MSEFEKLVGQLTPDVYANLKSSVELGKWPDGRKLTEEQLEISMQAVIAYEAYHNFAEEERTGYLEGKCKSSTLGASTENANSVLAYRVGN